AGPSADTLLSPAPRGGGTVLGRVFPSASTAPDDTLVHSGDGGPGGPSRHARRVPSHPPMSSGFAVRTAADLRSRLGTPRVGPQDVVVTPLYFTTACGFFGAPWHSAGRA